MPKDFYRKREVADESKIEEFMDSKFRLNLVIDWVSPLLVLLSLCKG